MIPSKLHTCPICGARHAKPRAHRVVIAFMQAIVFTVLEVAIVLHLDGWEAWALWAIVVFNVYRFLTGIIGLAVVAAGLLTDEASQ